MEAVNYIIFIGSSHKTEGRFRLTVTFPICENLFKQNVHKIKNKSHIFLLRKNHIKQ